MPEAFCECRRVETFVANPVNVGVETWLYGAGIKGLWREKNFQLVEDEWPRLRMSLIQSEHLRGRDRELACMFMALQIARTREHIAQTAFASELAEFAEKRPPSREVVRKFILQRHGHTPEDAEVEAAWTLATFEIMQERVRQGVSISMEIATTKMAPLLDGLH
jgi:hypothetical protein